MELSWLSPSFLWLLPLVTLPILAHLVRRPPKEKWFFGAMYLLEKVQQRNTTRNRIDDWFLLIIRILLLLALGLAILRPELKWAKPNQQTEYSTRVVILVDASLSMAQTLSPSDDTTALEWSKTQLIERMKEDQGQRQFELGVFGGAVEDVFSEWQADTVTVSAAVQEIRQSESITDLAGAIQWARQTLDGKGGEIWLYTDQAGTYSDAFKTEIELLVDQRVSLIPHTPTIVDPSNLAIVQATYGAGVEGGTLKFTVQNFGTTDVETRCTTTLPDGTEINTIVNVPANNKAESFVTIPRVSTGGIGSVDVLDSRLTLDNEWYFHLPQIGASRVVLVDGDPGTTPIDSEVYFMERALAPSGLGSSIVPEIVGDLSAVQPNVEEHAVIVLANVANPNSEIGDLVEYVRSGGGLLVSLGSNTNIATSNQVWAPLFPTNLKDRHSLASEYALGIPSRVVDLEHPVFSPFQRFGLTGFSEAKWIEVFRLNSALPSDASILLELENGMPLLVEYSVGKGKICLLLGSLDIESSNFPLQAVYMPFMQRLVGHLGGQAQGGERISATLGDSILMKVPEGVQSARWTSQFGPVQALVQAGQTRLITQKSGAYQLQIDETNTLGWVALNTNRIESDVVVETPLLEVAAEVEPEAFVERKELGAWCVALGIMIFLLQALFSFTREEVLNVETQ